MPLAFCLKPITFVPQQTEKRYKLTGRLEGYWSCSVSYDCRIIFTFRQDTDSGETLIVIVDIGKHDQVY